MFFCTILRQFTISIKNAFSVLFFRKQKGTRVFFWEEEVIVVIVIWQNTSYELRVTSYQLRGESLKTRVEIQKCEFKSTIYEFKSTSYEFKSTSYEFKSTSARIIKSMTTQVKSLKSSSFPKIISPKLFGSSWGNSYIQFLEIISCVTFPLLHG